MARVIRQHGLDGELRVRSYSDNPQRFHPGRRVTVDGAERAVVACNHLPDGYALLRLDGIASVQAARRLSGRCVYADIDDVVGLDDGEYYHYQLVGLEVVTDEGEHLGEVREVLVTGSNDVYVVESPEGAEILLPAVQQVVKEIDLKGGRMLVHLISGLR